MSAARSDADARASLAASQPLFDAFYAVIRSVERGQVASYGQIAAAAGHPRHARHVGRALRALAGDDTDVPWHRIVNAGGRISPRGLDGSDDLQRILLEAEGVRFDAAGRIDLRRFGWDGAGASTP